MSESRRNYIKNHPDCMLGSKNPNFGNGEKIQQLARRLTSEERKKKWGMPNEKNPRWNPNREEVLKGYSIEWTTELKKYIRQRDDFTCQLCGITEEELRDRRNRYVIRLRVHHINYDKGNCERTNLISLCNKCNVKVNNNKDQWKEFFSNCINLILEREKESWKEQ